MKNEQFNTFVVNMLTRLNTSSEITILPSGLGNHFSSTSHLVPPGRKASVPGLGGRHNSIFSRTSLDPNADDPEAPEANMSYRSENDYFGPDVLVIVGVILASTGATLTLVSIYCEFKHPAIQATIAGIGPSLIGIGMLFCVLRLFFCSFFTSNTRCECFINGLRYLTGRIPCLKRFQKRIPAKTRVHPLQLKNISQIQHSTIANGQIKKQMYSPQHLGDENHDRNGHKAKHKSILQFQASFLQDSQPPSAQDIEMTAMTVNGVKRSDKDSNAWQEENDTSLAIQQGKDVNDQLIDNDDDDDELDFDIETHKQDEDDILKDEIANLDKRLTSANSSKMANQSINDLVLKHSKP